MRILLGRRQLARLGLGAAALPSLRHLVFAEGTPPAGAADPGLLVLVSLRGGMDGLHLLSPADDRNFADARPPTLRSVAEGAAAGHRLDLPGAEVDFRLHAAAGPLAEIWRDGRMALWPAAGLPEPTRSHFEAQAMMGRGFGHRREDIPTRQGAGGWLSDWADRVPAAHQGEAPPMTVLAVQGGLSPELQGARNGLALADLSGGLSPPGGRFGATMLEALYGGAGPGPAGAGAAAVAASGRAALASLQGMDRLLPRAAGGRVVPYAPHGGDYATGRELGRALRVVAQAARLNPGLVAATIDLGGWDTHDSQADRFADRVRVLAGGLAAFDGDMQDLNRRWTVLVASEFGRRLRSNASFGTDHGRAGLVLAFGDRRFGLARQVGPWPGLSADALEEGVDLRVATDYRDAFRAVLADLAPGVTSPFGRV